MTSPPPGTDRYTLSHTYLTSPTQTKSPSTTPGTMLAAGSRQLGSGHRDRDQATGRRCHCHPAGRSGAP
ncbi:Hypothetical predicted protein, partial [Olea europaea subsp. europaea]